MRRGNNTHERSESTVNRRDVLKTAAGAATLGALGTAATGPVSAAATIETAFLADDIDLNLYWQDSQAWYDSTDDRTYHVYQSVDTGGDSTNEEDSDGDAYMVAYDHSDGSVEGPVRVGYNDLPNGDTHGVPSLAVDGDGFIHVIFGDHGNTGGFEYGRSENPYDISSWIHPPSGNPGSADLDQLPAGTYPSMTYDSNTDAVYVIYRNQNHDVATLGMTDDNGVTWTDINNGVIDLSDSGWNHTDPYVTSLDAWAGRIHVSWAIAESDSHGKPRRHVYHAAYNPSTGNMETMDGTSQGGTVSYSNAENNCKVKDTTDIDIGSDGRTGSVYDFNQAYDPNTDTAYIPVHYPVDSNTSQLRVLSYQGVSDGSGTWQESGQITTTEDPARLTSHIRINDSGELEVKNGRGKDGLYRLENGTWNHYDYVAGTPELTKIQRPVKNGPDEFGWVGRDVGSLNGETYRIAYVTGFNLPAGAGANFPRAPRNLRDTNISGTTVTIDWDSGMAGPSGVTKFKVYVDGTHVKDVTTTPPGMPYPRTWTTVDVGDGQHDIEVSLVNGNTTESAKSNRITVDTGTTTDLNVNVDGTNQTVSEGNIAAYGNGGSQDNGNANVIEGGDALELTGNAWKSVPINYTVTADTVLEMEVEVTDAGELTAIGVDDDADQSTTFDGGNSVFQIAGSDTAGSSMDVVKNEFDGPGPSTVSLDIGTYCTGAIDRLVFVTDDDNDASSDVIFRNISIYEGGQSPYGGTPWSIPGKIEAEDFDEGGEGVAYHDTTAGNAGGSTYRSGEDVDLGNGGSGTNLGWTADGEWLEYTVDVDSAGTYDLDLRVASNSSGGATIHFEFDGIDKTGAINVPNNGSWGTFQTITVNDIDLDAGQQVMRLAIDDAAFNLDWIEWTSTQGPYGGTAHAIPGKIEVEDFDTGGEGVAYHDTTAGNEGSNTYRSGTDVDLGSGGSGTNLGWVDDDEWLEYTVDVASAGTYDLDLRVTTNSSGGATVHFEFDGTDVTGNIDIPDNNSWSNFQTITETGITLDAGVQVMRLYFDSKAANVDWIEWY